MRHIPLHQGWAARWPNFTRAELSCKCCGQYYHRPDFLDKLQKLRDLAGRPIRITSAHRCAYNNALQGGAPLSQHLTLAADISLKGHNRRTLLKLARRAGFKGFGFYTNFLHVDLGRARHWYGSKRAEALWKL